MIQSILMPFIKTPFDNVGDTIVQLHQHADELTQHVTDFAGHVAELPDRVNDFFTDDYHPLMGAAFRFATVPLLLPTPLGVLAAGQAVLALAHVGSLMYDAYYYQDEIEAFFAGAKKRHEEAGTWPI